MARVCTIYLYSEVDSNALNANPNNRRVSWHGKPKSHAEAVAEHQLAMRRWAFAQRKAWADYWNHGRWRLQREDGWPPRLDEAGRPNVDFGVFKKETSEYRIADNGVETGDVVRWTSAQDLTAVHYTRHDTARQYRSVGWWCAT